MPCDQREDEEDQIIWKVSKGLIVGVMRPDEHQYANYDADHYFKNTIVPVGESSPQIQKRNE